DFGRRTRTMASGLRHFIVARDGGCVFPGCDRPPSFTEIHHREHWLRDEGDTEPENLEMLCTFHHHKVHEGGWEITIGDDPDRTPWFWPPDGRPPLQGHRRRLFTPPVPTPRQT
ncbi:MAG TPA: HNH endonuclease signature motif containing protein, partial [Frankiaceae bacterium]|nr:HNH endonuclease signature motif containing protein [Frankiaceae bacterium]